MKKTNVIIIIGICLLFGSMAQASDVEVSGKWEVNLASDHGDFTNIAEFEQDGENITVTIEENEGKGTLVGDEIRWDITLSTPMGDMDASLSGTVDGNSMIGDVEISGMTLEWTGKKI